MGDIVTKANVDDVRELIKEGRIKLLAFSPDLFVSILLSKKPVFVNMESVPDDVIVLAINFDYTRNMQVLKLVSKEFESTKEGDVIPFIEDGTITLIDNVTCMRDGKEITLDDVTTPVNVDPETGDLIDPVTREKVEEEKGEDVSDMKPIPEEEKEK
jgi:hypothetical protein